MRDKVDILAGYVLTPNAMAARRRLGRGEEVHGGDERRHLGGDHQVALHDPHLGDAAAGDGDLRHLGRDQGRPQAELHHGDRLRPRPRLRGRVPERVQGRRRHHRRLGALPGRQPGLLRLRAAREGHRAGVDLHLHPRRRAARGAGQGVRRARHRPEEDQGARLGRDHRRSGAEEHGRQRARHHHRLALRLQARQQAEPGVRQGVQRDARPQPRLLLDRRLRRHARDLRDAEEDQGQDRRRGADRGGARA